jgi:hypothetical protein
VFRCRHPATAKNFNLSISWRQSRGFRRPAATVQPAANTGEFYQPHDLSKLCDLARQLRAIGQAQSRLQSIDNYGTGVKYE